MDTAHHFIFLVTWSTLVFRINQCAITINITTIVTLIISMVGNTATPFSDCPNMESIKRHAVLKSLARKNTQVTLMRKNVNNASKKLLMELFLSSGTMDARTMTGTS